MGQSTRNILIVGTVLVTGAALAVGALDLFSKPKAEIRVLFHPITRKCRVDLYIEGASDGTIWVKPDQAFELLFYSDCPGNHKVTIGGVFGDGTRRKALQCEKDNQPQLEYAVTVVPADTNSNPKLTCKIVPGCQVPLAYSICLDKELKLQAGSTNGPEVRTKPPRALGVCAEVAGDFTCPQN